jgi:monofunctional biosynthetic peptidoglycan transglycosylase
VHPGRVLRVAAWIAVAGLALTLLPVIVLRWVDPPTSAFMMERRVEGIMAPSRRVPISYRWSDWRDISPHAKLAVVAAEDQNFLVHEGFDFVSIQKAMEHNRRRGRTRGASTISQQVAKNLFLWPGRNFLRKGLEAGYTVLIELVWPKQRILEVYLNVSEFGDGVYGVGAASRRYFDKRPSRLTRHEAALLAAVLPNPRRFRVERPSTYVQRRSWWIERQMSHLGREHLASLDRGDDRR